jgi:hypothetical protein
VLAVLAGVGLLHGLQCHQRVMPVVASAATHAHHGLTAALPDPVGALIVASPALVGEPQDGHQHGGLLAACVSMLIGLLAELLLFTGAARTIRPRTGTPRLPLTGRGPPSALSLWQLCLIRV